MQTQETKTQATPGPEKRQERLLELKKMRDEIRLKIHLGGLDVREAFRKIEPAVDKAELEMKGMAKDAAHAVANAATFTLDSLSWSLRDIKAKLPK